MKWAGMMPQVVVFEVDAMFAGAHHASMKMQREEQSGQDARGPQSGSQKVIFEVDAMCACAHHASMKMQRAEGPKASARADSG